MRRWYRPGPGQWWRPAQHRHRFGHADLGWPVVVRLGPVVEPPFAWERFAAFPPVLARELVEPVPLAWGALEDFHRDLPGVLDRFAERLAPAVQAGGFKVHTDAGHFKVEASLPGYTMSSEGEQPLSVKVVGQSLVVAGQKRDHDMVSSFQRSFRLPESADADRISVTYDSKDGRLLVDVPSKPVAEQQVGAEDRQSLAWESHDGGSHTTLSVSVGRAGEKPAGWPEALFEELADLIRDPLGGLFAGRPGAAPEEGRRQPEAEQTTQQAEKPAAPAADPEPPVLVQPKDTRPFWRLGEGASIDIVAPRGVGVGKPEGQQVPVYSASPAGEQKPIGHMELPVIVSDEECTWADTDAPGERVLQCKIKGDAVKKVHIKVAEEL